MVFVPMVNVFFTLHGIWFKLSLISYITAFIMNNLPNALLLFVCFLFLLLQWASSVY